MAREERPFDDLEEAIESLVEREELDPTVERALVEWEGDAVVAALIDVAVDEELAVESAPGGGQAPARAVDLLATRGDLEAVEPLARRLAETGPGTVLHDRIVRAMPTFGGQALDSLLDIFDVRLEAGDIEAARSLLDAAVETGGTSRRLNEALARHAVHEPDFVDVLLEVYERRDEVIELLEDRLGALAADTPDDDRPEPARIVGLCELVDAYEGQVPERLYSEAAEAMRRAEGTSRRSPGGRSHTPDPYVDDSPDVGRNDPCPCGSGRKYKKCCMR